MNIPAHIKEAIDRYVTKGTSCGHFVMNVLENNLVGAINYADPENLKQIREIVSYCYNYIPGDCWGSKEKVKAWIDKGGDPNGLENDTVNLRYL